MRKLLGLVGIVAWTLILIIVFLVGGDGSQTTNPDRGPAFMFAIYFFATAVPKIWMVLGRKDKVINTLSLVLFVLVLLYFMTSPNDAEAAEGFTTLQLVTLACLTAMPVIDFYDLLMQLLPKKW